MSTPTPASAAPATAAREVHPHGGAVARVGELDSGAVGTVARGGVIEHVVPSPGARAAATVSWWIGAEDRWHRPDLEASTRDRLVDGCPVVESRTRLPSGEAIGIVTVGRVPGVDRPSYLVDVENASPVPVVFAYVVSTDEAMDVDTGGISVDGTGRLTLTRPAMGFAVAPSLDGLASLLERDEIASSPPGRVDGGAVALLVPLPHTAHAVATFTPAVDGEPIDATASARLADRAQVPGPDRIAAGWSAHVSTVPRIELGDARRSDLFRASVADLLLGPDDPTSPTEAPPESIAAVATGLGRLGRSEAEDLLWRLVDEQRSSGAVRAVDPVGATAGLLRACGAWWDGGGASDVAANLVGPVAAAAHWLGRRRQASAVAGRNDDVGDALEGVLALLLGVGQPDVADDIAAISARIRPDASRHPRERRAAALVDALGDGLAWTDAAGRPDPALTADYVVAVLDETAAARVAGPRATHGSRAGGGIVELLGGWGPELAGVAVEAHGVPTAPGSMSFGVRWHGERPAVLWELTPWPGRPEPASVTFVAPSLDPHWAAHELRGEALLRPLPPSSDPGVGTSGAPQAGEGGTFS